MEAKQVRVARYIRVSKGGDQRPDLQHDETLAVCQARGWSIVETYLDEGSGSKDRGELARLMQDARKARFDVALVWRSDRAWRSLKHMVTMIEELAAMGVSFVSVTEPFDTTTPQGRLLLHIVSAMAEFERQLIIVTTGNGGSQFHRNHRYPGYHFGGNGRSGARRHAA